MRIAIDGVIGSGKSTAIKSLVWKLGGGGAGVQVHPEPVGRWKHLLEAFYEDPSSVAMDLQMRVLLDFSKVGDGDGRVHVVERSPATTHHVFGALAHQKGWLTDEQWATFKEFDALIGWAPDAIVYIDTPVDECMRRVRERSAGGGTHEPGDAEYLRDMASKYECLLKFTKEPVVRINGAQPPEVVLQAVADAVARLAGL